MRLSTLLLAVLCFLLPSLARGQVVNIPKDIDSSGKENVTAALNKFFASVPDGSTIAFPLKRKYRIEGTLRIRDKRHLIVLGNGSQLVAETEGALRVNKKGVPIKKSNRARFHLSIEGSQDITIENLKIRGPHKVGGSEGGAYVRNLEAQHGLSIQGSKSIFLNGLDIRNVYGDCIYIGDGGGRLLTDTVIIRKSFFGYNGRQGVALTYASNVLIDSCEFSEIRRTHIDLEPNHLNAVVRNVTVSNCIFGVSRLNWISAVAANTNDIYIINNKINNKAPTVTLGSMRGSNFGPFYFMNNRADYPTATGHEAVWRLTNVKGFYASGNEIAVKATRKMYLVSIAQSSDIFLNNNITKGATAEVKVYKGSK